MKITGQQVIVGMVLSSIVGTLVAHWLDKHVIPELELRVPFLAARASHEPDRVVHLR